MTTSIKTSDTVKDIVVAHFLAGRRKNYLLRRMSEAVTRTSEAASRKSEVSVPITRKVKVCTCVCKGGGQVRGDPLKIV